MDCGIVSGGLQVDDQLELRWLLDGEVGGFRALEDLVHVSRGPSEQIAKVWPVGHQAAGVHDKLTLVVNGREPVLGREFDEAGSLRIKEPGRRDDERLSPILTHLRKRGHEIVRAFYLHRLKARAQGSSRDLRGLQLDAPVVRRVKKDGHARDLRERLLHQFEPFPRQLVILRREPGGIPARSGEARDETEPYGVRDDWHDYRDCGRRLPGSHGALAARNDDVNLETNQVGSEAWESVVSSVRPPVLDDNVSPFDIAKLAESLLERFHEGGRGRRQHADAGDFPCLLRLGGERHGQGPQRQPAQERAPAHHCMISSARTRIDWGIVRPSALAVLRLITSSNFVGCSTGRSPGLAPLRILST